MACFGPGFLRESVPISFHLTEGNLRHTRRLLSPSEEITSPGLPVCVCGVCVWVWNYQFLHLLEQEEGTNAADGGGGFGDPGSVLRCTERARPLPSADKPWPTLGAMKVGFFLGLIIVPSRLCLSLPPLIEVNRPNAKN